MYRYYKLVFDDVDLTLEGEDEVWIRLEIYINGVEMTKQQVVDSGYVNASEWNNKQECLIMNIPTANIRYIGK